MSMCFSQKLVPTYLIFAVESHRYRLTMFYLAKPIKKFLFFCLFITNIIKCFVL